MYQKKNRLGPHRKGTKGDSYHSTGPSLCLGSYAGSHTPVTLSPRSAHSPSAHLHSYIQKVWGTRPKPANSIYPDLSLKPLVYHMASGQGYNPCDLLSYGRLTQPWIFTLGRKTLTCACSPRGGAQEPRQRESGIAVIVAGVDSQNHPALPSGSKAGEPVGQKGLLGGVTS